MGLAEYKTFLDDTVRPTTLALLERRLVGQAPPEGDGAPPFADLEVAGVTLGAIGAVATLLDSIRVSGAATLSVRSPVSHAADASPACELFYDFVIRLFNNGQASIIEALEYRWEV